MILSAGRMMYSGPRAGAVPWFTEGLGYSYEPARHGVAADWVLDLVNTTFKKPRVRSEGEGLASDTVCSGTRTGIWGQGGKCCADLVGNEVCLVSRI